MTGLSARNMCIFVTIGLVATLVPLQRADVRATTCDDVHIVWARATGAAENDPEGEQFLEELGARINPPLSVSDYRLGVPGFGGFKYEASGDGFDLLLAAAKFPFGGYYDSVNIGAQEFEAYMETVRLRALRKSTS